MTGLSSLEMTNEKDIIIIKYDTNDGMTQNVSNFILYIK
jgi:hypothetical protein